MNNSNVSVTASVGAKRLYLATAICLGAGMLWHVFQSRATLLWDFKLLYSASRLVRHGENPYDNQLLFAVTQPYELPFAYPLPIAFIFMPFTFFDYAVAAMIWFGLMAILWIGLIVFWWRNFNGASSDARFPLLALLLFNFAVWKNLVTGNVTTVESALLWTSFLFLIKSRLRTFAVFLLLAASFKMTPILFLGLLLLHPQLRRWKLLAGAVVIFGLYLAVAYAFAPEWFNAYKSNVAFNVRTWALQDVNPSTYALSRRVVLDVSPFLSVKNHLRSAGTLYAVVALAIGLVSWKVLAVLSKRNWSEVGTLAVLYATLVYALIVPRFSDYNYVLVIPAAIYVVTNVLIPRRSLFFLIAMLLPLVFVSFPADPDFLGDFLFGEWGFWSLLVVFACWIIFSRYLWENFRTDGSAPQNAA